MRLRQIRLCMDVEAGGAVPSHFHKELVLFQLRWGPCDTKRRATAPVNDDQSKREVEG